MRKRKKGTICIRLGLLLLAAAFGLCAFNLWDSNRAGRAAQRTVAALERCISEESEGLFPTQDPDREMPTVVIDGYRYIGLLEVPSLKLKLPVMAEWDYTRLRIAPCRYYGSVYRNDLVIAGHNYTTHFSPLKWIPVGRAVVFEDVEGNRYHYEVASVETLKPQQVEEMITGDWDLTLFTCNTGGQTRCTVRCVRTDTPS